MKILVVDTDFGEFTDAFYKKHQGLADKNYIEQKKALDADSFGQSYFFSCALQRMGHDAQSVILNNERLQRAWAKDHGVQPDSPLRKIPVIGNLRSTPLMSPTLLLWYCL